MKESYKEAFEKTKKAGEIAAGALDEVAKIIKPGIRTDTIDKLCYEYIKDFSIKLKIIKFLLLKFNNFLRKIIEKLSRSSSSFLFDKSEFIQKLYLKNNQQILKRLMIKTQIMKNLENIF